VLLLLREGVEVDKYCYHTSWIGRRAKILRLSDDESRIQFWPSRWGARGASSAVTVVFSELLGIVFGAYTCTFKRQRASELPPHWSAFSLVAEHRTYDFSSASPIVVECCVRGLQELFIQRKAESASPLDGVVSLQPFPLGLFLWMRVKFRLQEHAQQCSLRTYSMLWKVFMQCALRSPNEISKHRFISMAERLQTKFDFDPQKRGTDMQDLSIRMNFQKERVMKIVGDQWVCNIEDVLPRIPAALFASKSGSGSGLPSPSGRGPDGDSGARAGAHAADASPAAPLSDEEDPTDGVMCKLSI
jgi:hypothetical protein